MSSTASDQFRTLTGLGDSAPDPALGLENAKGKSGGKPVDEDRLDALHPGQNKNHVGSVDEDDTRDIGLPADPSASKAEKDAVKAKAASERADDKPARKRAPAKKTAAKKTAAKKSGK